MCVSFFLLPLSSLFLVCNTSPAMYIRYALAMVGVPVLFYQQFLSNDSYRFVEYGYFDRNINGRRFFSNHTYLNAGFASILFRSHNVDRDKEGSPAPGKEVKGMTLYFHTPFFSDYWTTAKVVDKNTDVVCMYTTLAEARAQEYEATLLPKDDEKRM